MTRLLAFVFVAFPCVCVNLHAQRAVTIKIKEAADGDVVAYKEHTEGARTYKLFDESGKIVRDQTDKASATKHYADTITAAAKKAHKVKREYRVDKTVLNENVETGALHGKTVLIERHQGKYSFRDPDGKDITGDPAEILAEEFNADTEAMLKLEMKQIPKHAVKVGENWKLDIPRIAEFMNKQGEYAVEAAGAVGTGTLLKIYDKAGARFGVVVIKMEFPLLALGKGNERVKFNKGAKLIGNTEVDLCIDGTQQVGISKQNVSIVGSGADPTMPARRFTIDFTANITDSWRESPRKPAQRGGK